MRPHIATFLDSLPEAGAPNADWTHRLPRLNEAITVPTQVPPSCPTKLNVLNKIEKSA